MSDLWDVLVKLARSMEAPTQNLGTNVMTDWSTPLCSALAFVVYSGSYV